MRNATTPHRNLAASPTAKFPVNSADTHSDAKSEPSGMYNILIALESVHRMLTVREVAELLQKSHFSIYRMAQRRQIPSLMIGGTRYFDPSVLAMWLSKKEPSLAAAARRLKTA
ncbi:MAG: helix-turn-helix domain-containing protein [Acidobacteriota bacterium]